MIFFITLLLNFTCIAKGQEFLITGKVRDTAGNPLPYVSVFIEEAKLGTFTDSNGFFYFILKDTGCFHVLFKHIGYIPQMAYLCMRNPHLNFHIILKENALVLSEVRIEGVSPPEDVPVLPMPAVPSVGGGIEALIATQPGVSQPGGSTSQISVRGGNFNENIVLINGFRVESPTLITNIYQEGMSIINPLLVKAIRFYPGNFSVKYLTGLSSLLEITYKDSSFSGFSLGANGFTYGGVSPRDNTVNILGLRYHTTSFLFLKGDISGNIFPRSMDVQIIRSKKEKNFEISSLFSIYLSNFTIIPEKRYTTFGTFNVPLQLRAYFWGKGVISNLIINAGLRYSNASKEFTLMYSLLNEYEKITIGSFYILETKSQDSLGGIVFGAGEQLQYVRNYYLLHKLSASNIYNLYNNDKWKISLGLYANFYLTKVRLHEYLAVDSFGYLIPVKEYPAPPQFFISQNGNLKFFSSDFGSFLISQFSLGEYMGAAGELLFFYYFPLHHPYIIPRIRLFRSLMRSYLEFNSGIYYQIPSYKEWIGTFTDFNTNLAPHKVVNSAITYQRSIKLFGKDASILSAVYLRYFLNTYPYKFEGLRIRYDNTIQTSGWIVGAEARIIGDFVSEEPSWLSLSIVKSQEKYKNLTRPFPTDQLIMASLFFNDYFPGNKNYKIHLIGIFGSGLPYGAPFEKFWSDIVRMPPYRRVDIAFSFNITNILRHIRFAPQIQKIKTLWLNLEVYNAFDIPNTIAISWIKDFENRYFAVPDYSPGRRFNLKLYCKF